MDQSQLKLCNYNNNNRSSAVAAAAASSDYSSVSKVWVMITGHSWILASVMDWLIRYNRSLISSHILPSIYLDIIEEEEEEEEEAGQELAVDQELSSSAGSSSSTTSAVQQLSWKHHFFLQTNMASRQGSCV